MSYFIDWLEIEQDFGVEIPESILCSIFDFGKVVFVMKLVSRFQVQLFECLGIQADGGELRI